MPEIKKLIELRSKLVFSLDWLIIGEGEIIDSSFGVTKDVKEQRHVIRRQYDRRQMHEHDRRQRDRREGNSLSTH